jgi:hypothetical protein
MALFCASNRSFVMLLPPVASIGSGFLLATLSLVKTWSWTGERVIMRSFVAFGVLSFCGRLQCCVFVFYSELLSPGRSLTIALIVAVVVLLLILVISLVVLYIKHRRIYSAYSQVIILVNTVMPFVRLPLTCSFYSCS